MKLVDILARELKAWPEPKSLLSGSADYCCQSDNTTEVYFGYGRTPIFLSRRAEDTEGVHVTRAEWQAAVDALKVAEGIADAEAGNLASLDAVKNKWEIRRNARTVADLIECGYLTPYMSLHHQWAGRAYRFEAKPEWSEDGLPNIGTKCVIYKGTWSIREAAEQFIGPVVTVAARFKTSTGTEMAAIDGGPDLGCEVFRADMCFHLPTAEEIAFREREDAIAEMMAVAGMGSRKACTALYDRNYRKQVTK